MPLMFVSMSVVEALEEYWPCGTILTAVVRILHYRFVFAATLMSSAWTESAFVLLIVKCFGEGESRDRRQKRWLPAILLQAVSSSVSQASKVRR